MKKKSIVSIIQVLAVLMMFPLFFTLVPWATSEHVSSLNRYPEMKEAYPPPEWAEYFTVGHGKPTYFRTSFREQPIRLILNGGALLVCWLFLIISCLHYDRKAVKKANDQSEKMTEECYICGGYFPVSKGIWQNGRNVMRVTQIITRPRFCCFDCEKKGKRNFVIALVLIAGILLSGLIYFLINS